MMLGTLIYGFKHGLKHNINANIVRYLKLEIVFVIPVSNEIIQQDKC